MCFPEFCSFLLTKLKRSILSSNEPSSKNICAFYPHFFDKSGNIITIYTYLINLSHRFFFYSPSNCFLGSFLQSPLFNLCSYSGIICHFFTCFFFICISSIPHISTTMYIHYIPCFSSTRVLHRKPLAHFL